MWQSSAEAADCGPGCGNAVGGGAERDGYHVPHGEGRGPGAAGGQDKGRRRGLCMEKKEQELF